MKKIALHLALILAQTATVCASERPWWETEVAREMALMEAQNEEIRLSLIHI